MRLQVFRALWGMTGSVPEQIERIAKAGYDGVEFFPEHVAIAPTEWAQFAQAYALEVIVGGFVPDKTMLEPTLTRLAAFNPLKINLHSGRDSMTREDGCAFFEESLRVEAQMTVPVLHETHRGRLFYTPWDTAFYLRQFEHLKITADYSHWVNVCERLPDDQTEAVELANQRTLHIHGRVGYEEGPQVPHPAAPEYANHLAWHEKQWQRIRQYRQQDADTMLTFTPEYGPPGYLHTLPYTNAPVADLWEICLWSAERARQQLS
jgi:sugar phosphate isomerase/epimerase